MRALVVCLHLVVALTACGPVVEQQLRLHLARHPAATGQDVYKFLYQAHFGPGHILQDPARALRYLEQEWTQLAPGPTDEPLCEGMGALVRLNLRPARRHGLTPQRIHALVLRAARVEHGARKDFPALLQRVSTMVEGREASFASVVAAAAIQGYPYLHHSEAYRRAYRPAYRLVLRDDVAGLATDCPSP